MRRDPLPALPRSGLLDSHIFEPQGGAEFDAQEGFETDAHRFRPWFAIIAVPSAETGDDPSGEGERTFRIWILLPHGLALDVGRYGFENGPIVGFEGLEKALASGAVTGLDELQHRDGGDGN